MDRTEDLGRIVVLGATGLVGRHFVEALVGRGARDVRATYRARQPFVASDVEWHRADLLDPDVAASAIRGAKAVVLCAGKISTAAELRRDPVRSIQDTLRIGVNALEAAAAARVDRFVLLSSCTGYPAEAGVKEEGAMFEGNPPDSWFGVGWMHRFLEKQLEWYCAQLGRIGAAIALRPTLIYGPHDDFSPESGHFVPSFIHRVVARERPIEIWGDGRQTRNLIHAADVASAILAAFAHDKGYAAFNVAASSNTSVNEVLSMLLELDGFDDAEVVHRLDKAGGASALDVSAAAFAQRFGWQPAVAARDGLAGTLRWYRQSLGSTR
jgi:nucleoside-diphosphate-sugar epimerase